MIFSLIHLYGRTSLIKASCKNYLDIVQYLVSKGANIEAKDKDILSQSSLWIYFFDICFKTRHLDIVQYLISKGANIETTNNYILSHSIIFM
jgi:ankyrin repeat protein